MSKRTMAAPAGATCPEGCYKHYDRKTRRWICCKCGN